MTMPAHDLGDFHRAFARWAAGVRSRLLLRAVFTGAAVGLVLAGVLAVLLWWQRESALRPWTALLGVVGALAGAAYAIRRRWTDGDVALFLDARLSSHEAVSTAVELRDRTDQQLPSRALIVERAAEVLKSGDPRRA